MSSNVVPSKTQSTSIKAKNMTSNNNNYLAEEEEEEDQIQGQIESNSAENLVTSHLYLKPAHSSQALDKEVVLQRIRQRKRTNKLRTALHYLIRLPTKPNNNRDEASPPPPNIRWVDDAFAAL